MYISVHICISLYTTVQYCSDTDLSKDEADHGWRISYKGSYKVKMKQWMETCRVAGMFILYYIYVLLILYSTIYNTNVFMYNINDINNYTHTNILIYIHIHAYIDTCIIYTHIL